jgi:transposase InsO family protein
VSRYQFIAVEKAHHSVVLMCRVLGVAKSAFYAWQRQRLSARARVDKQLTNEINDIYEGSRCTYGAPRVHAELRNRGKRVGRKRVARLMRTAGLVGRTPRRFRRTTIPDLSTQVQVQDLVQRQFDPTEPNQLWLSDITYIRTWEGWLYLAVILDAYSRKVVGWALADHMRTELVTAALQMALISRLPAPGLVCHSDRGSQYTSAAYRDLLEQHGLRHSVGQPGTCWDNAVAESFFATLKKELIYLHVWPTRQSARTAIFAFIEGWYNRFRLHSTLNYASPQLYEEDYYRLSAAA